MTPNSPYRSAAVTVSISWTDDSAARQGFENLLSLLTRRGIELAPAESFLLRPYALACVASDEQSSATTEILEWGLVRRLIELLDRSSCADRFVRLETSTQWLLASPDEIAQRRERGEVLVEQLPKIAIGWRVLSRLLFGLVTLSAVLSTLIYVRAWTTIVVWLVLWIGASLLTRRLKPRDDSWLRLLPDLSLLVPLAALVEGREYILVTALLVLFAASFTNNWFIRRRLAEKANP